MVDVEGYRSRTLTPEGNVRYATRLSELYKQAKKKDPSDDPHSADPHLAYVFTLLKQLAEAQAATDPALGEKSARDKDHRAFSALLCAGELVDAVAGWALDHVCGLSFEGHALRPRQPYASKSHPEYIASREIADSHEHERRGSAECQYGKRLDPQAKRMVLRNLLFGNSGGFPSWLREEGFRALDALSTGETAPLIQADPTGWRVRYRQARAELALLAIARFRHKAGEKSGRSLQEVCTAAGVEVAAAMKWEKELRTKLGELEVSRDLEFVANSASYIKDYSDRLQRSEKLTKRDSDLRDHHLARYGTDALQKAVAEYKAAIGYRSDQEGG